MEKHSNIKVKVRAIFVLKISFNLTSSFLKKRMKKCLMVNLMTIRWQDFLADDIRHTYSSSVKHSEVALHAWVKEFC